MIRQIKVMFYHIKYAFQRMERGYDDIELFNVDWCFIPRYVNILKDFRNTTFTYPSELNSVDEWYEILDEMIHCLEMSDEEYVVKHLSEGMPKGFIPDDNSVNDIMERNKNRFFELFSEWFYSLWI